MKIIFRIIWRIVRIIILIAILLAGYLAYQKFFNDTEPKLVIESLLSKSSESIQTVSTSIQDTTKDITWTTWKKICYEKDCYAIEIADTPTRRQKWLMFRDTLADDAWMLFIFEEPWSYNFWMKNTTLTLDMIWLDESFKILHINSNTPPCTADPCPSYWPEQANAIYVLEVNGGEAATWKVGTKLIPKNL